MKCSGKESCEIRRSDPVHHNFRPCPVELMSFLIAGFQCIEGTIKVDNFLIKYFYDLQSFTDIKCSGRTSCEIRGAEPIYHDLRPCPVELMSFLIAGYHCVEGIIFLGKM